MSLHGHGRVADRLRELDDLAVLFGDVEFGGRHGAHGHAVEQLALVVAAQAVVALGVAAEEEVEHQASHWQEQQYRHPRQGLDGVAVLAEYHHDAADDGDGVHDDEYRVNPGLHVYGREHIHGKVVSGRKVTTFSAHTSSRAKK